MHKCKIDILSKTLNGKVFKCDTCKKIHIEFKNLNFIFSNEEFKFFQDYFSKLDPSHWHQKNQGSSYHRKVMVPIGHRNFTTMFHVSEVHEFKKLLKGVGKMTQVPSLLAVDHFAEELILN